MRYLLLDLQREVRALEEEVEDIGRDELSHELRELRGDIRHIQRTFRRLAADADDDEIAALDVTVDEAVSNMRNMRDALREAREDLRDALKDLEDEDAWKDDDHRKGESRDHDHHSWEWEWNDDDWRAPFERHSGVSAFVGDFSYR